LRHRHASIAEQLREHRSSLADGVGADDMIEVLGGIAQLLGLGLPPDDPADARVSGERRGGGLGVGSLTVVDEENAVTLSDALHAVREATKGFSRSPYYIVEEAEFFAHLDGHTDVLAIVSAAKPHESVAILINVAVTMNAHHALRQTTGEALNDLARTLASDGNMTSALHLEKTSLCRRVSLEALVPVQMIRRDVEQHRHVAVEALG
jgi:hypothetical protein